MQLKHLLTAIICLLSLAVTGGAYSASLGTAAAGYNVFVFGNYTGWNSDTEGNLAAGGNINITNYSVASTISGSGAKLVADGNVTASNGGVGLGQNGSIYAGSTSLSSFTANGGIYPQNLVDFAAAETEYQNLSSYLSGISANGTVSGSTLTGSDPSLNVFSIDGNGMTFGSIDIIADIGSTILINVSGSGQIFENGQINLHGNDPSKVIFNFYESTDITITGYGMYGSFLASWADLVGNSGQFNGQMIAGSFTGGMESHNVMFDGDITVDPVPLPAAFWLFGSAFGVLSVLSRGRKQTS